MCRRGLLKSREQWVKRFKESQSQMNSTFAILLSGFRTRQRFTLHFAPELRQNPKY